MSSSLGRLSISKFLCRIGMLLVWVLSAANIAFYVQTIPTGVSDTAVDPSTASSLIDNLPISGAVSADGMLNLFGISVPVLFINMGVCILLAILATALLAMAIAMIDMRNVQARRSRH